VCVYNSKKNYLKDGAAENIVTDLLTEKLVGITAGMIVVAEIRNRKEKKKGSSAPKAGV